MDFECSKCSERIKARDEQAGETIVCPKCDGQIQVPESEPGVSASSPSEDDWSLFDDEQDAFFEEEAGESTEPTYRTREDDLEPIVDDDEAAEAAEIAEEKREALEALARAREMNVGGEANSNLTFDERMEQEAEYQRMLDSLPDDSPLKQKAWNRSTRESESIKMEQQPDNAISAKCFVCDSVSMVHKGKAGQTVVCSDCGSDIKVPSLEEIQRRENSGKPKWTHWVQEEKVQQAQKRRRISDELFLDDEDLPDTSEDEYRLASGEGDGSDSSSSSQRSSLPPADQSDEDEGDDLRLAPPEESPPKVPSLDPLMPLAEISDDDDEDDDIVFADEVAADSEESGSPQNSRTDAELARQRQRREAITAREKEILYRYESAPDKKKTADLETSRLFEEMEAEKQSQFREVPLLEDLRGLFQDFGFLYRVFVTSLILVFAYTMYYASFQFDTSNMLQLFLVSLFTIMPAVPLGVAALVCQFWVGQQTINATLMGRKLEPVSSATAIEWISDTLFVAVPFLACAIPGAIVGVLSGYALATDGRDVFWMIPAFGGFSAMLLSPVPMLAAFINRSPFRLNSKTVAESFSGNTQAWLEFYPLAGLMGLLNYGAWSMALSGYWILIALLGVIVTLCHGVYFRLIGRLLGVIVNEENLS